MTDSIQTARDRICDGAQVYGVDLGKITVNALLAFWMVHTREDEDKARKMIGKLRKDHGDGAVWAAFLEASGKIGEISDPKTWILGHFKGGKMPEVAPEKVAAVTNGKRAEYLKFLGSDVREIAAGNPFIKRGRVERATDADFAELAALRIATQEQIDEARR